MSGFASSRAQAEQDAPVEPTYFQVNVSRAWGPRCPEAEPETALRRSRQLEREKLTGEISENLGKLIAGEYVRAAGPCFPERTRLGLL